MSVRRPPMAETLPFTLLPPEEGKVGLLATPEPRFCNLTNTIYSGWIMTMLDSVMGAGRPDDTFARRNLSVTGLRGLQWLRFRRSHPLRRLHVREPPLLHATSRSRAQRPLRCRHLHRVTFTAAAVTTQ